MRPLLLALALLTACGSGTHGLVAGMWAQSPAYRLNSAARCEAPDEAIRIADLGAVLYAREVVARGWASYAQVAAAVSRLAVCILPAPEKCCAGSEESCVRDTDGVVRVKAGCSVGYWSWVSRTWQGLTRDVAADLLHELGHSLASTLGIATDPKHSTAWHTEIEPVVLRKYEASK